MSAKSGQRLLGGPSCPSGPGLPGGRGGLVGVATYRTLITSGVVAKHGVAPESIPDLLALVGDTADGIPGLPGWGKSSAAKVLSVWKHIDQIPDDPARWNVALRGADRLATALREHRAHAQLYTKLATLRRDCPIACDLDSLVWRGPDRGVLEAFCAELGLPAQARVLSLVAFNVGIEIAQLAFVAVLIYPLAWMATLKGYERWVVRGGSWLIAAMATFWMIERLTM